MPQPSVQFVSDYLLPGIQVPHGSSLNFHRITLRWNPYRPDSAGTIHLDPNSCTLDEFGDSGVCTLIAASPQEMQLVPIKRKQGAQLYAIRVRSSSPPSPGEADAAVLPMRLVTIPGATRNERMRARILLLREDRSIDRIIDLHRIPQPT
jgi:hypothetical protein